MKTLLFSAAFAAAVIAPTAANAQALPAAVVAVVDLDKVTSDCNACKTAATTLRGQVTSLQNREKALAAPLQTEQKAIQAAIDALNGKEPDAALQARIKAFQTKQQAGATEIQNTQQRIQNNQRYVQKQIQDKLGPIYSQVMQRRGATIMVEVGATLATAAALDVTADVVTALNAALPSLSVNAPAAPAASSTRNEGR
jgi:Skp family chaperone for outer membrane proteins